MEKERKEPFKPIDIKEVFAIKSPRMARLMPGFVYRFINRILHLDTINDFLERNGHLYGIEFVGRAVTEFNVNEHIFGRENVPDSGKFIFASNHPFGGFDGLLLMKIVHGWLGKLKFLSNDILMNLSNLSPMFIPVNKHGAHSREVARLLAETYESDVQILIFPSGLASRKIKGKVKDLEWKKHFISKSVQYKRDVIPIFIDGRNSNRFYTVAKIRKFLRLKWNLEMFLLSDEMMKHRDQDVNIYFGEPIPYSTFDNSKTHKDWAEWVKNKVYNLAGEARIVN